MINPLSFLAFLYTRYAFLCNFFGFSPIRNAPYKKHLGKIDDFDGGTYKKHFQKLLSKSVYYRALLYILRTFWTFYENTRKFFEILGNRK